MLRIKPHPDMHYLKPFPTRAEALLDVWDVDEEEICFSEWKYCGKSLPLPFWRRTFCVCLENEQKFILLGSQLEARRYTSPKHLTVSSLTCEPLIAKTSVRNPLLSNGDESDWFSNESRRGQPSRIFYGSSESSPSRSLEPLSCQSSSKIPASLRRMYHRRFGIPFNDDRCYPHAERTNSSLVNQSFNVSTPNLDKPAVTDGQIVTDELTASALTIGCEYELQISPPEYNTLSESKRPHLDISPLRFARRIIRGLRRSLSVYHVDRNSVNGKVDRPAMEPWSASNGYLFEADQPAKLQTGSRISRLFQCVSSSEVSPPEPVGVECSETRDLTVSHVAQKRTTAPGKYFKKNGAELIGSYSVRHTVSVPAFFYPNLEEPNGNSCSASKSRPPVSNGFGKHRLDNSRPASLTEIPNEIPMVCEENNEGEPLKPPSGYFLTMPGMIIVHELHPSLTRGRPFCFVFTGPALISNSLIQPSVPADAPLVTRIFAAPSSLSRLRCMKSLRRTAKPNLENELHRENSLRLSILEARNLSSKRRYYCDICLDRTLYARTTTKIAAPGIFWAEDFDLNNLPNVSVMTISLYKEGDSLGKEGRRFGTSRISMKKHKKPQNQLVGYLTIPMLEISGRNDTQVWLNLQTPTDVSARDGIFVSNSHDDGDISSDGTVRSQISSHLPVVGSETAGSSVLSSKQSRAANGDQNNSPQLRIRARYLSIEVLPLRNYLPLKTLILDQSIPLSKWLENLLPVKSKEEIANSLVALHECNGTVVKFLTDLVVNEVSTLENESMAFRSNTMATKAVECYVKLAGSTYLHNLLYRIIQKILTCLRAWEVDPEKLPSSSSTAQSLTVADTAAFGRPASSAALTLPQKSPPGSLLSNQLMLLHHFHLVWRAIQTSIPQFPSVLMKVFSSFRSALEPSRGAEFCDYLISGCIFLRLICPAVLSPSLFGLVSAFPSDPWCQRNLTLLAKSLQSLANFTTFDDKEPYMRFLNGYVSTQLPVMRHFIRTISTWSTVSGRPDDQDTAGGLRDLVDEGYELANLHLLLSDLLRTRSLDQKRNQEVTIKNTSSESSLIASPDLPKAFFQLPRLLNDLSFIRQAISNRSRSTHTGRHSRSKTQWLAKVTTTDQGMGPMTCSTASDFSIPPTTGCSLKSIPAAENVYQSHNPSSLIPYYTLHQNPGVVAPNTNGKQKTAVNILSPELRYAAPIANPSHNQSSVPVCGGKSRCLFSLPSVHDYDEPYYSRHSDSDPEDHRSEMVEGTQRACSAEPAYPDINLIGNGTSRRMTLPIPSAGASPSIIHRLSRGRTRNPIGTHDEDHIYDAVPLSDESSTDELADASEPEGSKSREVNHSQSNGYSPHEHVKNPHKPAVGGDAFTPTSETLLSYPSKSPRPTRLALGSRAEPGLSPRLLTKQIATASVLLSKSSVPDRSAEQAAITVQSNSSSGLLGPDDSNSQTLLTSPHSPTHSVQTTSVFLPLSQKHRLPKITTSRDSDKSPDRVNGSMGKNQANAMCSKENEESLLGVKQANGSSASSTGLEQEVVRLRQQLQISRADAARAANRLSQQEAELAQLRHLLAQVQAQPTILQLSQTSTASRLSQVSPAVPKPWTPSASVSTASVLEPQKQGSKNNAATFDELDDAMARLEHEQNELLREQSRIRARLAVTRLQNSVAPYSPAYSSSSSQSNGNEHQTLQSASQSLQLPSSAPIRGASKSYQNLFASGPPPILSQYGPKIRHAPPPQRYAQNPHNRRPP